MTGVEDQAVIPFESPVAGNVLGELVALVGGTVPVAVRRDITFNLHEVVDSIAIAVGIALIRVPISIDIGVRSQRFLGDARESHLAEKSPCQLARGTPTALEVFKSDGNAFAGHEVDHCDVLLRGVVRPVLDDELSINPEANAVIGVRGDLLQTRNRRLDRTSPNHREVVGRNTESGRPVTPLEIHLKISPDLDQFGEARLVA